MNVLARDACIADLVRLADGCHRYELVRGELRQMPYGSAARRCLAAAMLSHLSAFAWERGLGLVYMAGTGFVLDPRTVRAPDGAFVSTERAAEVRSGESFAYGAPDVTFEICEDCETPEEIDEKVRDWLTAGTRMVIVVEPQAKQVRVHRAIDRVEQLGEEDALDGADVVPGWRMLVREIFG